MSIVVLQMVQSGLPEQSVRNPLENPSQEVKKGLEISSNPLIYQSSPNCSIDRTFSIKVYFPEKSTKLNKLQLKTHRNPIFVAKEYDNIIKSGRIKSEADLARELGVSRVRVNQFIRLLKLDYKIINYIEEFGDPLSTKVITERMLRPYIGLSLKDQQSIIKKYYTLSF